MGLWQHLRLPTLGRSASPTPVILRESRPGRPKNPGGARLSAPGFFAALRMTVGEHSRKQGWACGLV